MIAWNHWDESDNEPTYEATTASKSSNVVWAGTAADTVATADPELEEAARQAAIQAEDKRRRREKLDRSQQRKLRRARQGRGHDPRRQVICRSRVQSRGKGRR